MKRLIFSLICLAAYLLVSGCMTNTGAKKLPEAALGYQPKKIYDVDFNKAWKSVSRTLETEKIALITSNKAEGRMVTDNIQGSTETSMGATITTRYSYMILFKKISSNKTRINIICKFESMSSTIQWHDISKSNPGRVAKLEAWLYERIENSFYLV
jgi:hypothetical protein